MINWTKLESDLETLTAEYRSAKPFEHLVIDGILEEEKAAELVAAIPTPSRSQQSRDYVFAKNKYEHPRFYEYGPVFAELRDDLVSPRFANFLSNLVGFPVFVDSEFVGGGVHQGGEGSFLDMHADFNRHPLHGEWIRELNILIYLNQGWTDAHGGHLDLRHASTKEQRSVGTHFNRLVVMLTKGHTLHGYTRISYPSGTFRTSVAAYAFSTREVYEPARSTVWHPDRPGLVKLLISKVTPTLVAWKSKLFGSRTAEKATSRD